MATPQSQHLSLAFLSQSYRPSLYSAAVITYFLATSAVILRFLARRLKHLNLWYDDWLCVVAWLAVTAYFIDELIWIHLGLGVHYQIIGASNNTIASNMRLNLFIEHFLYTTATVFAKLSLLAFYRRAFNVPSIRWPIWITVTCLLSWLVARYISITLHCIPVQAYWDKSIKDANCGVNEYQWYLGNVVSNFVLNLVVLILPMLYIKKLQVERSKKLAVAGMFTFGSFVIAISVILHVARSQLDIVSPDISWNLSPPMVWVSTEINLSVVSSCLPSLRPIYLFLTKRSVNPDYATVKYKSRQHFPDASALKNKALVTFCSKGHIVTGPGDDNHHPLSSTGDRKGDGYLGSQGWNIDLEEMQPPRDRVVVREEILVQYSNV